MPLLSGCWGELQCQTTSLVVHVVLQAKQHLATFGHRLPRIDKEIQEHLLNLISVGPNTRNLAKLPLNTNPILQEFAFQQH